MKSPIQSSLTLIETFLYTKSKLTIGLALIAFMDFLEFIYLFSTILSGPVIEAYHGRVQVRNQKHVRRHCLAKTTNYLPSLFWIPFVFFVKLTSSFAFLSDFIKNYKFSTGNVIDVGYLVF